MTTTTATTVLDAIDSTLRIVPLSPCKRAELHRLVEGNYLKFPENEGLCELMACSIRLRELDDKTDEERVETLNNLLVNLKRSPYCNVWRVRRGIEYVETIKNFFASK